MQSTVTTAEKLAIYRHPHCHRCNQSLLPAELFAHGCFHSAYTPEARTFSTSNVVQRTSTVQGVRVSYIILIECMMGRGAWCADNILFRAKSVKALLDLCGKDYMSTTAEEMDKCEFRFRRQGYISSYHYRDPKEPRGCQEICTWRTLLQKYPYEQEDLRLVTQDDLAQVIHLEENTKVLADKAGEYDSKRLWYCSLCAGETWCSTKDNVERHISTAHGILEPSEEHMRIDTAAYSMYPGVYLIHKGTDKHDVPVSARNGLLEGTAVLGKFSAPLA